MSKIIPPKMLQMCIEHCTTGETEVIEQKLVSTTKELIDWTREISKKHKLRLDGSVRWMLQEAPGIKDAVTVLTQALFQDPDFFQSYKANIAMEFKDECCRRKLVIPDIDDMTDTAAYNFLTRWIGTKP